MGDEPLATCHSCDYPIVSIPNNGCCPECGANLQSLPPAIARLKGGRGTTVLICVGLSMAVLGFAALLALAFPKHLIVDLSIETTYWGWWIAAPPAILSLIFFLTIHTWSSGYQVSLSIAGIVAWIFTSVGILLHSTSHIHLSMALSAFAPIATICLFMIPILISSTLHCRRERIAASIAIMLATLGMASYVGMLTSLYYDYSIGLHFYLGSSNADLVDPLTKGGLVLFSLACYIDALAILAMLDARHRLAKASPSSSAHHPASCGGFTR